MTVKMSDTKIIRDLTLTYRAHSLATNYGQGIRKLHGIPGATSVINLVNFDRLVMVIDGASFVIERDYRY